MSMFSLGFASVCYNTTGLKNECLRIGIAGSIATMICECSFHIIDTVNIRSKVMSDIKSSKNPVSNSTYQQIR